MLRDFRSRRRPHYGGFLCAVVSALLLLLSLSLLRSHTRGVVSPTHEVKNYDSLLSDSANDDATGGEDAIDALDVVEEPTDAEDDDEPLDDNNVSGYFFYHVEGVIRRYFTKRSMQQQWDDNGIFDTTSSSEDEEDRGRSAFGSDDVAVDERVRKKAMEVKGIEDALLLKVAKRVSPLREGWGNWFDKKGDFLRKDKTLRSNLEALNPLHNPILQDPDSVGLTGLTKVDKLLHKSLLHEFKTIPFPPRKITRNPNSK